MEAVVVRVGVGDEGKLLGGFAGTGVGCCVDQVAGGLVVVGRGNFPVDWLVGSWNEFYVVVVLVLFLFLFSLVFRWFVD